LWGSIGVRDESDRLQEIQSDLHAILAEGGSFDSVVPRVLQAVCERLGWDVGIAWRFDHSSRTLRFVASWHDPSGPLTELERLSERSTVSPGVGLPGRVVAAGEPCWITDVQTDRGFPRSEAAMADGLHGAFGFPLLRVRTIVGIVEFFSKKPRELDEELLVAVAQLGPQLGALIGSENEP
jgi:signal transduction protein with GAF and PtsI domain